MKRNEINYTNFMRSNIKAFLFKVFVIFFLVNITITYSAKKLSISDDSVVMIYIRGLVVNPEAFIFAHDKHFQLEKYDKAACDLRYAEGLTYRGAYSKDMLLKINEKKKTLKDLGFDCE